MLTEIEGVLRDREKTHGDFKTHAVVSVGLKQCVEEYWKNGHSPLQTLTNECVTREALDMILHKIGRIVAGDEMEPDHWLDIVGYATLVVLRLADSVEEMEAGGVSCTKEWVEG